MPPFEDLEDRLLRGGVAYRHARRFARELSDHNDDAVQAARDDGHSVAQAHDMAMARIGAVDDLAASMIAQPELQALGARYPRAWNGAGPVVIWTAVVVATVLLWVAIYNSLRAYGVLPPGGGPILATLQTPADAIVFLVMRAAPVVIGARMLALAVRQRLALAWPLVGAAVAAAVAGFSTMAVIFSVSPDQMSQLAVNIGVSPDAQVRVAAMFALMLTPLLWRARLKRPSL